MYDSHTLPAQHCVSKPECIEGAISSDQTIQKIPNGTSHTNINKDNQTNNKSNCNPSKQSSFKPPPIETSTPQSHNKTSPISPRSPGSRKHHKKKRGRSSRDKHTHAPILIFPYSWNPNVKDDKYENNKQFHKKAKPIPPRITIQHGIDHLLSPSKCSKRYLSAYCLNLHQLTTSTTLLDCIIKKLTPVIKQLHHITNETNTKQTNSQPTNQNHNHNHYPKIISPSISPTECEPTTSSSNTSISFTQYALKNISSESPFPTLPSPTVTHIQLNVINDNDEHNVASSPILISLSPRKSAKTMSMVNLKDAAHSLPHTTTHNGMDTIRVPLSGLDLVETRSCPDLDEYHSTSDDQSAITPPKINGILSSTCCKFKPEQYNLKKEKSIDYKTKMKAYCIATIKHNIDIIYHWIYYYPSDFADKALLERLVKFISKVKNDTSTQNSILRRWNKLLQLIQHRKPDMKHSSILSSSISNLRIIPKIRRHEKKTSFQFTDSFFPPREMVQKLGGGIDLLHIHPALVADQLTLIDTEIFLQIGAREFTNQAWQNRPNLNDTQFINDEEGDNEKNFTLYDRLNRQKIDAPNLLYMIDHVNRLSLWVATEILSRSTTAEMADLTKYFYVVAHRCLELCNIHTCTAIFGGICLQPLTRLRRLNRYLSDDEQIQQLHAALSEMVSSNDNYKTYRDFMQQWFNTHSNTPCIPFIPVVMKDLFQIQLQLVTRAVLNVNEENKEEQASKCIDLGLLEKNCRHIRRVYETQQKAKLYANQLPADTDIQSKLRMNIAKFETHETLRAWSFDIQPKLTKEDKGNLDMIDTLEEFGFL